MLVIVPAFAQDFPSISPVHLQSVRSPIQKMLAPSLHVPIPQMSMGEQLFAAEMHVRNMWEPTGWDLPETAFDLDQEDVDTVSANLAPQRTVKVKVEKEESVVVRAEKTNECTHVSNPSLRPSPPTSTDDVSESVHMLSEKTTTWSSSTASRRKPHIVKFSGDYALRARLPMGSAQPATSVAGPSFAGRSGHNCSTLAATPRRTAALRPPEPPTKPPPPQPPPTELPPTEPPHPRAAKCSRSASQRRTRARATVTRIRMR